LKPAEQSNSSWQAPRLSRADQEKLDSIQDDWRVILVFLELYTFVLKLMDDEEFFSGSSLHGNARSEAASTWAGHNALPLQDVQWLTSFLKNLGFAMYFNAAEISDMGERDSNASGSISSYFRVSSANGGPQASAEEKKPREFTVAGLSGMSLDYVKGLVTGLLRMIYERDSRRKFLPKDHWLMTSRFDMEGFIPAVVAEEENRHRVQEEDDADVDDQGYDEDDEYEGHPRGHLIGTQRELRTRHLERLRRQQRRASRKRYLQAVAPRLEILQNLPFFIPFETRVQIFRDFVRLDQVSLIPMLNQLP
jgi:ubiquitin-protein ligase E3 C